MVRKKKTTAWAQISSTCQQKYCNDILGKRDRWGHIKIFTCFSKKATVKRPLVHHIETTPIYCRAEWLGLSDGWRWSSAAETSHSPQTGSSGRKNKTSRQCLRVASCQLTDDTSVLVPGMMIWIVVFMFTSQLGESESVEHTTCHQVLIKLRAILDLSTISSWPTAGLEIKDTVSVFLVDLLSNTVEILMKNISVFKKKTCSVW